MSKQVLILVEGQTEERFVKDVLGPAFYDRELFFHPTILVTKRVKDGPNFKGGVTNFVKFRNDTQRLLHSAVDRLVTTMLDYYRLPPDFPGMATRPPHGTPLQRAEHVEAEIKRNIASPVRFIPFLALHEFEAWLFSSPTELPRTMTNNNKQQEFTAIRASVTTPEEINDRPGHSPSKRIESLFPGYKKALHGPTTAARIGIERIRSECPHFHGWITELESFAAS